MESVLLLDNTISTQSLTPESDKFSVENNENSPIPTLFIKKNEDAFLILKETSNLLPSPPPQDNIYNPPKKRKALAVKIEEALDDKTQLIEEGCKWCQRCGTFETPRWRYGPGGPLR